MHCFVVRLFLVSQLWLCLGLFAVAQESTTSPDAHGSTRQKDQSAKSLPDLKKELSQLEAANGKQNPDLIPVLEAICTAYEKEGAYVTALPFAQQALQIQRKIHGESDLAVAGALNDMGTFDRLAGDNQAAIEQYQLALPIVEKKVGTEHPAYAMVLMGMGASYLAEGKIEEAQSALEKAE